MRSNFAGERDGHGRKVRIAHLGPLVAAREPVRFAQKHVDTALEPELIEKLGNRVGEGPLVRGPGGHLGKTDRPRHRLPSARMDSSPYDVRGGMRPGG